LDTPQKYPLSKIGPGRRAEKVYFFGKRGRGGGDFFKA